MSEILAPLGGYETLAAALNSGADAVYGGLKIFSARGNAENFSEDELKAAVTECHRRGVKFYVTINTLVYDNEIPDLIAAIKQAASCAVDGMILQDLGAAYLSEMLVPDMPRHASTQMSLNSISGVKAAEELGYCRVVIGRELSKTEISRIKENTDTELEIFVHGALCVCVSGQCYMSSIFGGRSGNRGLCAQPCRLDFSIEDRHNVISLKDSSLVPHLSDNELSDIASFKIEGRMKRPEYVACAVNACRNSLNGESYDKERLGGIFSRGGLTDGYYFGDMHNMQGIRRKEDVDNSAKALNGIKELYKSEYPRIKTDISLEIRKGKPVIASVSCEYGSVDFQTDIVPEEAKGSPISSVSVCDRMSKLGGTQFYGGEITASVDDDLYLSASSINSIRREIVDKLDNLVLEKNTPRYSVKNFTQPPIVADTKSVSLKYRAEVTTAEQLRQALSLPFEMIYSPMDLLSENLGDKDRIAIRLPHYLADCEEETEKRLLKLREEGYTKGYAQTLGDAYLLKKCGFSVYGGYRMNITNSFAAKTCKDYGFEDLTLSFECSAEMLAKINCDIPRGIVAYGRLPLMLTRRCPIADGNTCGRKSPFGKGNPCGKTLIDRLGNTISVNCCGNCVELLNPDNLILSDKQSMLEKFDFAVLRFTEENDVKSVYEMYVSGVRPRGKCTSGRYFK